MDSEKINSFFVSGKRRNMDGLKILDSNGQIAAKVRKALRVAVQESDFLNRTEKITQAIANFLYEKFISSSTYFSLTSGTLRAEFGLDDVEVAKIPDIIIDMLSINSDIDFSNGQIKIVIKFIDENFDPNKEGSYVSVNKKGESHIIPWLLWLLTAGDKDVVADYSVALKDGKGRSEMAIMIKPNISGSYSVDPEYSGTENDNWITKTIRYNFPEIQSIIIGILQNAT
jgi:hypothetical protein